VYQPGAGGNRQAGAQAFSKRFQLRCRRVGIKGDCNGRTGDAEEERRRYCIVGHEQYDAILGADPKRAQLPGN